MPLNPRQIDRYSRQIIVPGMGGRTQERLLSSQLVLIGERQSVEPALLYMAGAGVGTIGLAIAGDAENATMPDAVQHLNPDVTVSGWSMQSGQVPDLILAIVESAASLDKATEVLARLPRTGCVIGRIDSPPRITVLPSPPPCPRCAGAQMLSRPGNPAEQASIVAMAATVEAFKLLAGYAKNSTAGMIEFDGYESHFSRLAPDPNCDCARTGA